MQIVLENGQLLMLCHMLLMRLPVFKYFWNNSREIQGQVEATEK